MQTSARRSAIRRASRSARPTTLAVAVAAVLSGCSSGAPPPRAPEPPGTAQLTVDGRHRDVEGPVTCTTDGAVTVLTVGSGITGVVVTLGAGDPPRVHDVGLGSADGTALGIRASAPGGAGPGDDVTAVHDGASYVVSGTVTGVAATHPFDGEVRAPFELRLTCPAIPGPSGRS